MKKSAFITVLMLTSAISAPVLATEYYYDDNGNLIKQINSNSIWSYTYDENGNKITFTSEKNGSIENNTTWTYDRNNNVLTEHQETNSGVWDYAYTYDNKGNLLTSRTDNSDGSYSLQTYTYNDAGKLINMTNEDNGSSYEYSYTYDDHGNILTQTYNGGSVKNYSYTYDDNGNVLEKVETNDKGKVTRTWTYDSDGTLTNETSTIWEKNYAYDEYGNLIHEDYVETGGYTLDTRWNYIYDEKGNVLSMTKSKNGQVVQTESYTYDEYGNVLTKNYDSTEHNHVTYNNTYSYADPNWKANKAHREWLSKRKRIYTIEEATKLSKETGNKFMIRYK